MIQITQHQGRCDVSIVPPEQWDEIVKQFRCHTVFHLSPWLNAVAASHGLKLILAAAHRDGECVAVFPILTMRKGIWKVIGSPLPGWSTAYLGPLFQDGVDRAEVMNAFLRHDSFLRYGYFACKVLNDGGELDLGPHGFHTVLHYDTYRLDLNVSHDDLWGNLRRECRNHIRKAQKSGIEIRCESTGEFIDDYWRMSVETFARTGLRPTHDRRMVQEIWNHLHPAGMLHSLSAFHDGERIATILLLKDCRTMYYWGGAAFLRFRHLPAHNLLQWEGIGLAKSAGCSQYDFISTTGGPGKFKQSFGPECVAVATHWERSASRLTGFLKGRYESYLKRRQQKAIANGSAESISQNASVT